MWEWLDNCETGTIASMAGVVLSSLTLITAYSIRRRLVSKFKTREFCDKLNRNVQSIKKNKEQLTTAPMPVKHELQKLKANLQAAEDCLPARYKADVHKTIGKVDSLMSKTIRNVPLIG